MRQRRIDTIGNGLNVPKPINKGAPDDDNDPVKQQQDALAEWSKPGYQPGQKADDDEIAAPGNGTANGTGDKQPGPLGKKKPGDVLEQSDGFDHLAHQRAELARWAA